MTITNEEKQGLKKFYEVNITSVKEGLEALNKDLDIAKVKRTVAKTMDEKHKLDIDILLINDKISRFLGMMDVLNAMKFCSV